MAQTGIKQTDTRKRNGKKKSQRKWLLIAGGGGALLLAMKGRSSSGLSSAADSQAASNLAAYEQGIQDAQNIGTPTDNGNSGTAPANTGTPNMPTPLGPAPIPAPMPKPRAKPSSKKPKGPASWSVAKPTVRSGGRVALGHFRPTTPAAKGMHWVGKGDGTWEQEPNKAAPKSKAKPHGKHPNAGKPAPVRNQRRRAVPKPAESHPKRPAPANKAGKHPETNKVSSKGRAKRSPVETMPLSASAGIVIYGREFPGAIGHRLGAPRVTCDGQINRDVTVYYGGHTDTHTLNTKDRTWEDYTRGRNPLSNRPIPQTVRA